MVTSHGHLSRSYSISVRVVALPTPGLAPVSSNATAEVAGPSRHQHDMSPDELLKLLWYVDFNPVSHSQPIR